MITGKLPFPGEVDQVVIYSILNKESVSITDFKPGVPKQLEQIIYRALEKNPDERYQHVDEIQVDLRAAAKEALIKIQPEENGPIVEVSEKEEPFQFIKRIKRHKKMALLIAAVTVVALVALFIFITHQQRSKFIVNRIVVVPFENKTEDESLEMLGQMAAEMITQGMSQISEIEAVPFISVMDLYSKKKEKPSAFMIATQNNAGVLITGSICRVKIFSFGQVSWMLNMKNSLKRHRR